LAVLIIDTGIAGLVRTADAMRTRPTSARNQR
jgi:hypothetical protein